MTIDMQEIEGLIRDGNARTEADLRAVVEAVAPTTQLDTTRKHLANAKRRIVDLERDLAVARIERDAARDAIIRIPIRTSNKAADGRVRAANDRAAAAEARAAEADVRAERAGKSLAAANRARIEDAAAERVATAKAVALLMDKLLKAKAEADALVSEYLELEDKYDRAVIQIRELGGVVVAREIQAAKQRQAAKLNMV
jgi:hypothetical protein